MNEQKVVLLASYPRSGNTFLRHVLEKVYGVPTWTVYQHEEVTGIESNVLGDGPRSLTRAPTQLNTAFLKTHHMPYEICKHAWRSIYLVRDGRDAISSQAHYEQLVGIIKCDGISARSLTVEEIERHIINGTPSSEKMAILARLVYDWGAHVLQWTDAADVVIRFEDLVRDPVRTVNYALREIGLYLPKLPRGQVMSFEQLHAVNPLFFRSGKSGGRGLSAENTKLFWSRHGEAMRRLGINREEETI